MSQILELTSWQQFKDTCITGKNLNCQYVDFGGRYELYGPDANGLTWHTNILKDPDNPAAEGSDQYDFEQNYKAQAFNFAVGSRSYAFATPDFMFNGDGVKATITAGTTANIDFKIPGTLGTSLYINGAVVITSNSAFGDYATADVVDVDGIVYPAGTVLAAYVTKWYIDTNRAMDIATPYAGKVPAGMYMRVGYTSVGLTNVGVAINFRLHKPL